MIEEWRDIVGFEGFYEISSLGRVRSHITSKILSPSLCSSGYPKLTLCKYGRHTQHMVHRLVAKAFLPNPDNMRTVNHIDGNKQNNQANNLEWCSHSDNQRHAYRMGLNRWNPKKGRKSMPVIKMDLFTHEVLGEYPSIGDAFRSIEDNKGKPTRYDNISKCCKGQLKSACGYYWRFKESEG